MKPADGLPAATADDRLDELFVRYWDDALTSTEEDELGRRLTADPAARAWFGYFALQVLAAADTPGLARAAGCPRLTPAVPGRDGDRAPDTRHRVATPPATGRGPW